MNNQNKELYLKSLDENGEFCYQRYAELIRDDERKQCLLDYLEDCYSAIDAARLEETKACAKQYLGMMRDAVEKAILREREACAKLCDDLSAEFATAERCADSIRARSDI